MCPSCDTADYIEVPANDGLKDLTSGQVKTSPAFNEKRIERERKKAVRKIRKAAHSRKRQSRASRGMVAFNWLLVLFISGGVAYFAAVAPPVDWQFGLPSNQSVSEERVLPEAEEIVVPEKELDRLLPQVFPSESGPFEPLKEPVSGEPSYFDPCRAIYWVVNPENEPEGSREHLVSAFEEIQIRTGLLFVFAGETDEKYDWFRDPRNNQYPEIDSDWKPVIVWYLPEAEFESAQPTELAEDGYDLDEIAGFAGPDIMYSRGEGQRLVSVSGAVTMNATWSQYILDAGFPAELWWVLAHEIGHVVGLDHVDDPDHLMHSKNNGYKETLGPGDIEGLAVAGSTPCLKESEYPGKADWVPYDRTAMSAPHSHIGQTNKTTLLTTERSRLRPELSIAGR